MFGKGLSLGLGILMLVSCSPRHIMTEEELQEEKTSHLEFYIDWRELDVKPTGITLYFFPVGSHLLSNKIECKHYNTVDHVTLEMLNQDYSVICFNQSESEFAKLKFNFDSYEEASVMVKDESEMPLVGDEPLLISPQEFASAAMPSVKAGQTRGYNATGSLVPRIGVASMSIDVFAFGVTQNSKIVGVLTNLSQGLRMMDQTPLDVPFTQPLPSSIWKVDESKVDTLPSKISVSFGTFGLPLGLMGTRAAADEPLRNILKLSVYEEEVQLGYFEIDVTDMLYGQWLNYSKGLTSIMSIVIGRSDDKDDGKNPNSHITPAGSLVLDKKLDHSFVDVSSWEQGDTIQFIIN